jgi:hypothetical protein
MEFGHAVAATQKGVGATLNRISALIKPKPEQEDSAPGESAATKVQNRWWHVRADALSGYLGSATGSGATRLHLGDLQKEAKNAFRVFPVLRVQVKR